MVENGLPEGSRFSPLRMLNHRKRATKAGAMALARRKASNWHTDAPVAYTSAQESTASLVATAAIQELEVDRVYRLLIELVESGVPLTGQQHQWIHVDRKKWDECREFLMEITSHND